MLGAVLDDAASDNSAAAAEAPAEALAAVFVRVRSDAAAEVPGAGLAAALTELPGPVWALDIDALALAAGAACGRVLEAPATDELLGSGALAVGIFAAWLAMLASGSSAAPDAWGAADTGAGFADAGAAGVETGLAGAGAAGVAAGLAEAGAAEMPEAGAAALPEAGAADPGAAGVLDAGTAGDGAPGLPKAGAADEGAGFAVTAVGPEAPCGAAAPLAGLSFINVPVSFEVGIISSRRVSGSGTGLFSVGTSR